MFTRRIRASDVETMLAGSVELIEDYPFDLPFPSRLLLGFIAATERYMLLLQRNQREVG